jgi:alpha-mannosidase
MDHSPSLFPELIPDRLERAIQRLGKLIWHKPETVPGFVLEQTAPCAERRRPADIVDAEFRPVAEFPYHWGRMFEFSVFRLRLDAPVEPGVHLHWRDQGEATLYHEGVPYWGLDELHKHCPLPQGASEFLIESVCCRTGIWGGATGLDPEGSRHDGLQLVRRNEAVWQLWMDFQAARDVIHVDAKRHSTERLAPALGPQFHPHFNDMAPATRKWLRAVDRALDCLDDNDIESAHARMQALFKAMPQGMAGMRAVLTGHAHIDLVWLWPERVGEFKATHTFATMNRLLEQYPEFHFGYSQPASYEAVGRFSPELLDQVRDKIAGGRWEALGATHVESDTQLACGEALARSFVIGQDGFEALTGKPSPVLWLPDVFGYSACLPQIMCQCDVRFFFTTKLTWSLLNRFPYSSFRWQGIDGSEVIVHLSTGGNGYNSRVNATELTNAALQYPQADVHDAFVLPTGHGDGGGGVTEEILERARRFRKVPQLPECEWGRMDTFFETLERVADSLPAYRGELYLEYHRGVQTTHGALKAAFRRMERALQALEAAHSVRGLGPVDPDLWKRLVFAQFHDYIPGSSIAEVYREHVPELLAHGDRALADAAGALGSPDGRPGWFNPLPYAVLQPAGGRMLRLPPLACVAEADAAAEPGLAPVAADQRSLRNGIVAASFTADGRVESLLVDGAPVAIAAPLGQVALYADKPAAFDAWDIDYPTLGMGKLPDTPVEIATESTATEAAMSFTRTIGRHSTLTTRYSLRPGDTVLRIRYTIDWREPECLLKAHFPTRYHGRHARYGAPFGSVTRPQLPGTRAEEAQWEVPASRWAVVADDVASSGLFVVTEAKYGFACRNGNLQLSLVRSPEFPTGDDKPQLRDPSNPTHTDLGEHVIELAIGAFAAGAPRERQPFVLADTLFTAPLALAAAQPSPGLPDFHEAGNSLHLCWVKPLDGRRCVLRFNELLGKSGILRLKPDPRIRRCSLVDLRDRTLRELAAGAEVPYDGYALLGVRIEM